MLLVSDFWMIKKFDETTLKNIVLDMFQKNFDPFLSLKIVVKLSNFRQWYANSPLKI